MKRLLATTAIALLAAAPLSAQTEPATPEATAPASGAFYSGAADPNAIYGSDLIGMTVYSSATKYDNTTPVSADATSGWDNIGDVKDVLISPDGQVEAVLVDVGGFLGMGEHTVALDMSQVHILTDENGNRFVAVNSSKEELEAAPEFQRTDLSDNTAMNTGVGATPPADNMAADTTVAPADNMAADNTAPADTAVAPADNMAAGTTAPADTTAAPAAPADSMAAAPATDSTGMGTRPNFQREGYGPADYATLTAEDLEGATVYDANDDDIGEISQLILDPEGKITQAVVDVGGFLGMGEHSVALSYDELQIMKNSDNGELRVYVDATKDDLEQRPEYEG